MKEPSPSTLAWLSIGAGVITYDLLAPEGQTLSEGFRRGLEHPIYKFMCAGLLGSTALHLLGLFPEGKDPFTNSLKLMKGL